jgi:hypothetical protein
MQSALKRQSTADHTGHLIPVPGGYFFLPYHTGTISGQRTYIHILLKLLIMARCCINMTSAASSLDKFPLYISVPTVTRVRLSPYPHVNLQNPVSIYPGEGTVQAPYKKCMIYQYSAQPASLKIIT